MLFLCKASQYSFWSISEPQRWLSTARNILRNNRFHKNAVDHIKLSVQSPQLCNNNLPYLPTLAIKKQLYQHTVHRVTNHTYFTSSSIAKSYKQKHTYVLPLSNTIYLPKVYTLSKTDPIILLQIFLTEIRHLNILQKLPQTYIL